MKDKDFQDLSNYRQGLDLKNTQEQMGTQKPMTFYEKYIKKDKSKNQDKESKSAIWWMIMIFCIVYGIEIVYNALIAGPAAP